MKGYNCMFNVSKNNVAKFMLTSELEIYSHNNLLNLIINY